MVIRCKACITSVSTDITGQSLIDGRPGVLKTHLTLTFPDGTLLNVPHDKPLVFYSSFPDCLGKWVEVDLRFDDPPSKVSIPCLEE